MPEIKHVSVVRKPKGYGHIPQTHAKPINACYEEMFNSGLNFHRSCLSATEVVSEKGKNIKRSKQKDVMIPLERLVLLNEQGLDTLKAGIKLEELMVQVSEKTNLQAA